jgi:hypothetical protein
MKVLGSSNFGSEIVELHIIVVLIKKETFIELQPS